MSSVECGKVCALSMNNIILSFQSRVLYAAIRHNFTSAQPPKSRYRAFLQPRPHTTILDCGINRKLPDAYRKFYKEWKLTTPMPVHYIPQEGRYLKNKETEQIERVVNVPINLSDSPQEENGIWGGEAVIDGYVHLYKGTKIVHDLGPAPRFWFPKLKKSVIYSEVLDKYMVCELTTRAQILINNHFGLDNYLLETRACDLRNLLAVKLKRKILHALLHKSLYPHDEPKRNEVYDKYKKFLDEYTPEEIDWYGLTLLEARMKLAGENIRKSEIPKVPLKYEYRREFIEELQTEGVETTDKLPWYKRKLLPFK